MVTVYFETSEYSIRAAAFDTEELYKLYLPMLEKQANNDKLIVIESVI